MDFNFFGKRYLDLSIEKRKRQGTIMNPFPQSYEIFKKEKILMITDNINDKEFHTCLNFVIKYLNKIIGENFPYHKFNDLTKEEREKFNIDYTMNPIEDIFDKRTDIFKESKKLRKNSIVIYADFRIIHFPEEVLTHIGFCIEIFSELWVISKFGDGALYLHKINKVPSYYGRNEMNYLVMNTKYEKYMGQISNLLEKRINLMKELKNK